MSGHLVTVAGYLDLPPAHKLALMKVCDSSDDQTRLGFPGLEAVRLWAGVKKSRGLEVIRDLQDWGLIMQVEAGRRGHRAVFKAFPAPGDEAFSLAVKQGKVCPGAEQFAGVPSIPNVDEVAQRVAAMDAQKGTWAGSGKSDPAQKGPDSRTLAIGSDSSDPATQDRVRSAPRKGPTGADNGSNLSDPLGSDLPDPFQTHTSVNQLQSALDTERTAPGPSPSEDPATIDPDAAVPENLVDVVAQSILRAYTTYARTELRDERAGTVGREAITLKQSYIRPALVSGYSRNVVAKALGTTLKKTRVFLPPQPEWRRHLTTAGGGNATPAPTAGGGRKSRYRGDHWEGQAPAAAADPRRDLTQEEVAELDAAFPTASATGTHG